MPFNSKSQQIKSHEITSEQEPSLITNIIINNSSDKYKIVHLHEGTYFIDKQISINNNITIVGVPEKTIIRPTKNFEGENIFLFNNSQFIDNISFKNIFFNGIDAPNINAIKIVGNHNITSNISIQQCKFENLNIGIQASNIKMIISNNNFTNVKHGLLILNCLNCKIYNNTCDHSINCFTFNDTNGAASENVKIYNNYIYKITNYPIHFADVSTIFHNNIYIYKNRIIGDTSTYSTSFTGGSADMVSVYGGDRVKIKNNKISGGGDMGITIQRSQNVKITHNNIDHNAKSGIVISSLGSPNKIYDGIFINKNTIMYNGQYPLGGNPASLTGIYLEDNNESGVSIILGDNKIINNQNLPNNRIYQISARVGNKSSIIYKGNKQMQNNEVLLKNTKISIKRKPKNILQWD
ncbi:MAG: right-handed parallel beta-helix repeat-containing protein [Ignavibacteria bacterium]|nr:right-handed parallel beta-helix repeat-containing protein [Ignavibacteria bacterium]